MNISVYYDNMKVEILLAYCNSYALDKLKYDQVNKTFVENYLPNHKIGIIHLASKHNDKYRLSSNNLIEVITLDNKIMKTSIRFIK
jgi:hypothetical protein